METENWKWFRYDEIFDIKKGKRLTKADMIDGDIPYIGAIDSNNGVSVKIGNDEHLHCGNVITASYNGSIAEAFYQSSSFWATDDVNVLYPKFELNEHIAMFLITLICREKYRFNYGRKWNKELMQNSLIKLPVITGGSPDWQFMENYARKILSPKLSTKSKAVWQNKFDKTPLSAEKLSLNIRNWQWFNLSDKRLFTIKGSKTTSQRDLELSGVGDYPYITTQATNNGVKEYYNYATEKGMCFTMDSAVKGYCSWHEEDFSASDHVEKLIPNFKCNNFVAMFIVTVINLEQYRYNYGIKCSQTRIRNMRIKLPVDSSGNPDWQFMEDYIKSLPYSANL